MSIFCVLNIYPTFFSRMFEFAQRWIFKLLFVAAEQDDRDAQSSSKTSIVYGIQINIRLLLQFGKKFEVLAS